MSQSYIKDLFDAADTDKSGLICKSEMLNILNKMMQETGTRPLRPVHPLQKYTTPEVTTKHMLACHTQDKLLMEQGLKVFG